MDNLGVDMERRAKKETLPEIPTPARRMPLAAVDALGRSIAMQVRLAQGPQIT